MWLNTLFLALREIRRNLLRSFLTILGIVIGVAAVITMVTIGRGATQAVSDQITSLGTNLLMVRPGQRMGPGRDAGGSPPFRQADGDTIAAQVSGVRAVAPQANTGAVAVYGARNWSTVVSGTTNAYFETNNWTLAQGRQFEEAEQRAGSAVCVIGATVRRELFATEEPVGARLRLRNISCEVIGLLQGKGQAAMGNDQDDLVVMPIAAVQRRLTGNLNVNTLLVSMHDGADAERVKADMTRLLRERRKLAESDENNFNVLDTQQLAQTLSGTTQVMTMLLGAVAAVSLLVGGIGIILKTAVTRAPRASAVGLAGRSDRRCAGRCRPPGPASGRAWA
ncbi:MAG: multidrug ABC transporter substrate-binding protein, partial [Leptothrix sp. (in: Bacteria)]|nr:multidrug ABC transporter substrate-binding protein [Leptothrix sp. (in: b-proteobacteria)]